MIRYFENLKEDNIKAVYEFSDRGARYSSNKFLSDMAHSYNKQDNILRFHYYCQAACVKCLCGGYGGWCSYIIRKNNMDDRFGDNVNFCFDIYNAAKMMQKKGTEHYSRESSKVYQ